MDINEIVATAQQHVKNGQRKLRSYSIFQSPNYQLAAQYFEQALVEYQQINDVEKLITVLELLAKCYDCMGNIDKWIDTVIKLFYLTSQREDWFQQLIPYLKQLEPSRAAKITRDYADYLVTHYQYQLAVDYYQQSSVLACDQVNQTYCQLQMANLLSMHQLDLVRAIQLYQQIYDQFKESPFYRYRTKALKFQLLICACLQQKMNSSSPIELVIDETEIGINQANLIRTILQSDSQQPAQLLQQFPFFHTSWLITMLNIIINWKSLISSCP